MSLTTRAVAERLVLRVKAGCGLAYRGGGGGLGGALRSAGGLVVFGAAVAAVAVDVGLAGPLLAGALCGVRRPSPPGPVLPEQGAGPLGRTALGRTEPRRLAEEV